jgi:glycosyltransferase involved in cell wall biosynthesis
VGDAVRIVMFSMTPLFPDRSMGGAQKQLRKIATHLGILGHTVEVLCTWREDAQEPFHWLPNVRVEPVFRFRQPFPEPYNTPIYNIANAIATVGARLAGADRYYSHDGGLIFPDVYRGIPTVVSLRSVLFAETLQSGFLFAGHTLIVPSEHARDCWLDTAGSFYPELQHRIRVVPNGLDFAVYREVDPTPIHTITGLAAGQGPVILYPHRPDDSKGIRQTIALAQQLVHRYGHRTLRVLVPRWIDSTLASHVRRYYDDLSQEIEALGLTEHVLFHDWIPDELMPAYYSAGTLTVALGDYVETFGNTITESLACGTPVIASAVGPYRAMAPVPEFTTVAYGDIDHAARVADRVIRTGERVSPTTYAFLYHHYDQSDMVDAYAEAILNATVAAPMAFHLPTRGPATRYRLPRWVQRHGDRFYHEFRAEWRAIPALAALVAARPTGFRAADAQRFEIGDAECDAWLNDGWIVAIPEPEDAVTQRSSPAQ